ncbi:carbohydrate ABC transporter permease [Schleiferilactobacillus harbinensis]|uniref:Sugar ABC transporter permease n=3 Tax=Schleiferilactobacillus harbinensis TaxID=304207 RepID=A0ABU7SZ32_9LACO|nr:sugar ABC transporter permease [Schleiferilactobacillus harbinensis]KRM27416.1 fructose-amino acid permease [Schleiferilactobacillus harbinensis DSM 16991]MCI1688344.1 sugar ABC transporter permease [Schleiferilactobacillus harbinensis]MCI1784388.1 sugar ABC transporter permease [Schleiferilactobacillus harbinensis]MCI1851339.1 sugar ABC transporter permease [Schleiferilactobacillus harbinensis]
MEATERKTMDERNTSMAKKRERMNRNWFFFFISPWLIGFLCLTAGPMIFSFFMSFTNWDLMTQMKFIGIQNYVNLFKDPIFLTSMKNTFLYAAISVPLNLLLSLGMAYLLSFHLKGMRFFRTLYYLPAIVPAVASTILFTNILATNGLLNKALSFIGIQGPSWLLNKNIVLLSFVFLAVWGVGATMVLLLSSINSIDDAMYESATLDGATRMQMFVHITLPQISPVIFFNLITGIIGSLQTFTQVYLMTKGGPDNASQMIVPYLYTNAFSYYRMGYASAMAWVLFFVILILSVIVLKSSSAWVFYEQEVK